MVMDWVLRLNPSWMPWRPCASVAFVTHLHCTNCGSEQSLFSGFAVSMRRQTDGVERLVSTPILDPAFPKELHELHTAQAGCMECLSSQGFKL